MNIGNLGSDAGWGEMGPGGNGQPISDQQVELLRKIAAAGGEVSGIAACFRDSLAGLRKRGLLISRTIREVVMGGDPRAAPTRKIVTWRITSEGRQTLAERSNAQ